MDTNIYTLKNYSKVEIVLKNVLDKKGISRNKLSTMIAANYNLVNRYYNNSVIRIDDKEFISLTDLARYADEDDPRYPIQDWMRNKEVISYLGLWESIHNKNFKGGEFDTFKNEAGSNKFKISPQKWIGVSNMIICRKNKK